MRGERTPARWSCAETGWRVRCGRLLDTWIYRISPAVGEVLIITYACSLIDEQQAPVLSHEHVELGLFDPDDVGALPMPEGYRASIRAAHRPISST